MFKIGQKVRVVEWVDMPEDAMDCYGMNTYVVGSIGVVMKFLGKEFAVNSYDIIFEGNKYPSFFLEPELEPLVKVGEQLEFEFMD